MEQLPDDRLKCETLSSSLELTCSIYQKRFSTTSDISELHFDTHSEVPHFVECLLSSNPCLFKKPIIAVPKEVN